jgi:hypothetical protein
MSDDVVEAMARGMWCAVGTRKPCEWATQFATTKKHWRNVACAAIRAVHERGGLVVARMPENKLGDDDLSAYQQGVEVGWNNALLKVRAAAVEVE